MDNSFDKNEKKEPKTQLQEELEQTNMFKKKNVQTNTDATFIEVPQTVEGMEKVKPISIDATTNTLNDNTFAQEKNETSITDPCRRESLEDMPTESGWYSCIRVAEEKKCCDFKHDCFMFNNNEELDIRPKTRRRRAALQMDRFHSSLPNDSSKSQLNVDYLDPAMMSLHDKLQAISETSSDSEPLECVEKNPFKDSSVPVKETGEKTIKLSLQLMPSINIRSGLSLEPTLKLSINPDGVVHNSLQNKSNINYGEIVSPKQSKTIMEVPKIENINEISKNDSKEPFDLKIEDVEHLNEKLESEVEYTNKSKADSSDILKPTIYEESNIDTISFSTYDSTKKLKLIQEKLNTNPTIESLLEFANRTNLFAADKTNNRQKEKSKMDSTQSSPSKNSKADQENALEVTASTTTSDHKSSIPNPTNSDSSGTERKLDHDKRMVYESYHITGHHPSISCEDVNDGHSNFRYSQLDIYRNYINPNAHNNHELVHPDADENHQIGNLDIDKLSKKQIDKENKEPILPPAVKLLEYGFLQTASTQCDLGEQFGKDKKIVENAESKPKSDQQNVQNDKISDETVELVIKLVNLSESKSNSNEKSFEKQFDLKNDRKIIKEITENEEPVKEYSTDTSVDESKSKHSRICSGYCKKKHLIDQKLKRTINLKHDLLSKNVNLDQYEIKDRSSVGISPRILSRRNKLKIKQLTDSSVTESMSEGEIKGGNVSLGEVLNQKHPTKQNLVQVKKFPEVYSITNSNIKIEQHKHYFNNWVTYFISEENDKFINDSSSASSSYK